jgi:hypothetical protein
MATFSYLCVTLKMAEDSHLLERLVTFGDLFLSGEWRRSKETSKSV